MQAGSNSVAARRSQKPIFEVVCVYTQMNPQLLNSFVYKLTKGGEKMEFSISNITRHFTHDSERKAHYSLTCSYTITESTGLVYKVVRTVFSGVHEGHNDPYEGNIGSKFAANYPTITEEFRKRVEHWEAADHGLEAKNTVNNYYLPLREINRINW